ncbi:hypothetical protein SAMN02927924_02694 [Sphingobium faniae]|nr:hypothetical protein SAMN02927924_02694 [Sphingobium faniae]
MPVFSRHFAVTELAEWNASNPGNAVRALLDGWALPGTPATASTPLRLAIRAGYVNFYAKGQSVARLDWTRTGPSLSVHQAYVEGRTRDAGPDLGPRGQKYVPFDSKSLAEPGLAAAIDGWIGTALSYASAEKRFVDDLVASNSGVIDLEMGLPAHEDPGSARVAPRMDLVLIEQQPAGPAVVFWEAKCANNSELRSNSDYSQLPDGGFTGPKVLHQIGKYVEWMGKPGRIDEVRSAYRKAAATMLQFQQFFGGAGTETADCVALWRLLADSEPVLIVQPGIVIGNYWPENSRENIASGRMAQAAASFLRNGHREKLDAMGVVVHEV